MKHEAGNDTDVLRALIPTPTLVTMPTAKYWLPSVLQEAKSRRL